MPSVAVTAATSASAALATVAAAASGAAAASATTSASTRTATCITTIQAPFDFPSATIDATDAVAIPATAAAALTRAAASATAAAVRPSRAAAPSCPSASRDAGTRRVSHTHAAVPVPSRALRLPAVPSAAGLTRRERRGHVLKLGRPADSQLGGRGPQPRHPVPAVRARWRLVTPRCRLCQCGHRGRRVARRQYAAPSRLPSPLSLSALPVCSPTPLSLSALPPVCSP